jgi:type IV pilus assembly protein PilQ
VKFFGSNSLGEVVTAPDVIVRNAKTGKIQIGKDIFITTRDIAGNTVNQQVSTGTIIDVLPTIFTQNDTDFVSLHLHLEQSDVAPDKSINKTSVNSDILLYDGEEAVLGGLYTTIDNLTREGIPFLKDLPPWVFGLRYIFGSESIVKTKQELIILLKVELSPQIRSRIAQRSLRPDVLEQKRKEYKMKYDKK